MADGTLIFDTAVDTSGVESAVKNGISESVRKGTAESEKELNNFFQHTLANLASEMISKITSTAAQAVSEGIELASDVKEVKNVIDTTFGSSADTIYSWAGKAEKSFGISSLAAQQYTGTLGAMLKSSGVATNAISEMSTTLVGLSGDMASFYNLDIAGAFEKIRSGISGETEPLKQLGINMSVANLEAYALANGIQTAYSEMSQAEQIMLRYQYLLSVTSDAQGDFSKTADSFANQQRIMQLNFQNMKQALGEELMPAAQSIIEYVNQNAPRITETVRNVGKAITDATDFLLQNKDAIADFATGAAAAAFAYKGLTAATSAASAVQAFTVATQGAAAAQSAMNIAAMANPYILIGTAAIAGAAAFASWLDRQRELIGYEGEVKEAYNESNEEIARRIQLLSELKETDPFAASQSAAEGLGDTVKQLEEDKKRLEQLYEERSKLDSELTAWEEDYSKNNYHSSLYTIEEAENMSDQLDSVNQEIAGLEEQILYLETLKISQEKIAGQYNSAASQAQLAAEDYKNKQIAANETSADEKLSALKEKLSQKTASEIAAVEANNQLLADEWAKLDHQLAMGIISDDSALYQQRLALLNKYGDESNSVHWKYYEELADYRKEQQEKELTETREQLDRVVAETKSGLSEIDSIYSRKYNELIEKQNSYRSQLMTAGGDIFDIIEGTDADGNKTKTYQINDIDAQIQAMKAYHEDIKKLKNDGASAALLEEISALSSEDAARMADYIAGLSESERQKVISLYREKEAVADELSADLYAKEAASMQDAFAAAITDMGINSYASGQAAAEQFANGFNGKLSELINVSAYSTTSSVTASANSIHTGTAVSAASPNINVNVEVTGGDLTFDGEKYGAYTLDYQTKTDIQKG